MKRSILIIISFIIIILSSSLIVGENESSGEYVDEEMCGMCHFNQKEVYGGTEHSTSYEALEEMEEETTAECLTCHTVGYEKGGYISLDETPELARVGCQSCHGPSGEHISSSISEKKNFTTDAKNSCVYCHNEESDPEFDFDVRWEKIKH